MFGLEIGSVILIDILSQILGIPNKLMRAISEVWHTIITCASAIMAEIRITEQLTFTFSVNRSLLQQQPTLKVETHSPPIQSPKKEFSPNPQSIYPPNPQD
jgi:hypothetical protein